MKKKQSLISIVIVGISLRRAVNEVKECPLCVTPDHHDLVNFSDDKTNKKIIIFSSVFNNKACDVQGALRGKCDQDQLFFHTQV